MGKSILNRFMHNLVANQTLKCIKGGYGDNSSGWQATGGWNKDLGGNYTYDAYNPQTGEYKCFLTYSEMVALGAFTAG